MPLNRIDDPRLMAQLRNFEPERCTIRLRAITQSATGELLKAEPGAILAGHESIPAFLGKDLELRSREKRTPHTEAFDYRNRVIGLAGYYPAITTSMVAG